MTFKVPFTPGMREVLALSKAEAGRMGSHTIRPDDYVLAIIRKEDGLAFETLVELRVNTGRLKEFVESSLGCGAGPVAGSIPPSESAKVVLDRAVEVANSMKHGWVGTEHLLITLAESPESVLGAYLLEQNISSAQIREAALRVITGESRVDQIKREPSEGVPKSDQEIIERMLDGILKT